MKLRFRKNSLRLRLNRREVEALSAGASLEERVFFPNNGQISYILEASSNASAHATFQNGVIRISAPQTTVSSWAGGDAIGMYFDLPAGAEDLKIAIEKDLECVEGPPEERDPDAFPRSRAFC
jgi:hypothetical protein